MTSGTWTMRAVDFGAAELDALDRLNRLRAADAEAGELEAFFMARYAADRRFAVYGTLAPGKPNHHQMAALCGDWDADCTIRGALAQVGWGADLGYPALHWSESGDPVPGVLFVSDDLPAHWPRLDAFEGEGYLRILVPVHAAAGIVAVANTYAARPEAG